MINVLFLSTHGSWDIIFRRFFFIKVHFWVKKRHYIFGTSIPGQILKDCSRAFEGLSYLAYKIQKMNYVKLYFLFAWFKSPFSVVNIYLFTCAIGIYSLLKRDNWIMWIQNINKHKLFCKSNMTDLQKLKKMSMSCSHIPLSMHCKSIVLGSKFRIMWSCVGRVGLMFKKCQKNEMIRKHVKKCQKKELRNDTCFIEKNVTRKFFHEKNHSFVGRGDPPIPSPPLFSLQAP